MKQPKMKDHFTMVRTYTMADFVTMGNGCCGAGIILFCLQHLDSYKEFYVTYAFLLFPLAIVFDVLDGWVARARHSQSILGADLDSFADLISFGVAPAVLGFTLGLRGMYDCLLLLFYICCCMSRLARYNAERMQMTNKKTGKVNFFRGFPAPFACLIVVVCLAVIHFPTPYFFTTYFQDFFAQKTKFFMYDFHLFATLYLFVGCGMISSSIKIPHL
eukprot:Phypoly_transcript_18574.p1 GENE.Phypoly_transcript_18574~~Phypoly_transcript_18574.p1  ORF type:complete len:217 (+),score=22.92 Phypoly_transcript_18574:49-699(+)